MEQIELIRHAVGRSMRWPSRTPPSAPGAAASTANRDGRRRVLASKAVAALSPLPRDDHGPIQGKLQPR
jgi:hypothetical protein